MKLETAIFCEYARTEATGQLTLIGCFPTSEILIQPIGVSSGIELPSFALAVVVGGLRDQGKLEAQCTVLSESKEILASPRIVMDRPNREERFQIVTLSFTPLRLPGVGDYWFKLAFKAGSETRSFSKVLKVKRAPLPSGSNAVH